MPHKQHKMLGASSHLNDWEREREKNSLWKFTMAFIFTLIKRWKCLAFFLALDLFSFLFQQALAKTKIHWMNGIVAYSNWASDSLAKFALDFFFFFLVSGEPFQKPYSKHFCLFESMLSNLCWRQQWNSN